MFSKSVIIDTIMHYRMAMYVEDGGSLRDFTLNGINKMNLLASAAYLLVKTQPFEARTTLQLMQSIENLAVLAMVIFMLGKQWIDKTFFNKEIIALNLFFLASMVLYGAVVFNFGTAARYRFPFIALYLLIYWRYHEKHKQIHAPAGDFHGFLSSIHVT